MDDETREALEMSKDELAALAEQGKPARVRRKAPRRSRDLNQRAHAIVEQATADRDDADTTLPPGDIERVTVTGITLAPKGRPQIEHRGLIKVNR